MIHRRAVLGALAGTAAAAAAAPSVAALPGADSGSDQPLPSGEADRAFMLGILERMALPILERMASGRLKREWTPAVSPTWDGRPLEVAYLEAFGRLMDGIAPWLALPDNDGTEGRLRRRIRDLALESYARSVDPKSPDRLAWEGHGQTLVDSAYYTGALLRAPDALWKPLDSATKQRIVGVIKGLRRVSPPYQNWLLFASMNEAFLFSAGEDWDPMRVDLTVKLFSGNWYAGDGWYQDGEDFHFDYYNSYVIQPMLLDVLRTVTAHAPAGDRTRGWPELLTAARARARRYAAIQERLVAPDGTFPPTGRSIAYRAGAFQLLAQVALQRELPDGVTPAQVRGALTAVTRRTLEAPGTFDARGWLTIGLCGHQPSIAEGYISTGSLYLCSASLLPLGLPPDDPFWADPPAPWTSAKAWSGVDLPPDRAL